MLKIAIAGAGYFSHFQIEAWQRIPNVHIVAVCDRDLAKAQAVAARYGIGAVYSEAAPMLDREQPHVLDIITPPVSHYELCELAAQRGVHIICQKPLAPTYAESVQLLQMLQRYPVRFMVHENFRWQPWYREIKRLILANELGEAYALYFLLRLGDGWGDDAYVSRQPFFRDYRRLLVFETGGHFIDTFRYLFGEVVSVYARLRQLNPVIKGEDSGQIVFGFANGVTAVWDANRYNESTAANARYTFGTLRLDGSKGHLELNTDGKIYIKPLGNPMREHLYTPSQLGFAGDCVYALQNHFVQCLNTGAEFESNGTDYLLTLKVVEACYASTGRNEVIFLDKTP
ncbi:MAG: Gfo/Idh/MocA family oxidoreductase [Anaerolineae bacterium]|nr:Gfo/Idh/MocA family oxidoreductase [Anaerolineae bacterium]